MVAHAKPKKWKKEGKRLRGEGEGIKFTDSRFERRQAAAFRKGRSYMNDALWDRFCGLGCEITIGCEWVKLLVTHLRGTGIISLIS